METTFLLYFHCCPETTGIGTNPVSFIGIYMKTVVAEFVLNPQKNKNAAGHAYGKTCNID